MSSPPSSEWTDISPSVIQTIETTIQQADKELREISLGIHAHPELGWEEHYAHDALTRFMESKGFEVERHAYGFDTAWRATCEVDQGGRTIGFNSESKSPCRMIVTSVKLIACLISGCPRRDRTCLRTQPYLHLGLRSCDRSSRRTEGTWNTRQGRAARYTGGGGRRWEDQAVGEGSV
jgi:hypothetical protein